MNDINEITIDNINDLFISQCGHKNCIEERVLHIPTCRNCGSDIYIYYYGTINEGGLEM